MQRTTLSTGLLSVAALSAGMLGGGAPAGADDASQPAPDAAVVETRTANAMTTIPAGYDKPADVQDTVAVSSAARMKGTYLLDATSRSGGYIRVLGRDNPAQDRPGFLTTTMRIYGNVGAFRDGPGPLSLESQFTCSGIGISGLTIGTSGASVTGGPTSGTLTLKTTRSKASEVRQYYAEGGHFRCKASNASPAKTTHRATGSTEYKNVDTRAQDEYSFWW